MGGGAIPRLEDFTGYLLRLAHVRAHELADRAFPEGPHPREYSVLTAVAAVGPVSQQRLAEDLYVNRTLMVGVADKLERRGLLERRRDPSDRRSYSLYLTDAGVAELERLHGEIERVDRTMTERLTDGERARLNALLRKLLGIEAGDVPAPLADRTGFLLTRAHFSGRERANELLRPTGILLRHFGILSLLAAHGPSSQQALAKRLSVSPTMITQIVDEIEALGLAARRRNPDDRRSYLVTTTPEGGRKLKTAGRIVKTFADEYAAALGPDGDHELRALLRKMLDGPSKLGLASSLRGTRGR
jgi:DNA-binding MarR family transcriptional regulator